MGWGSRWAQQYRAKPPENQSPLSPTNNFSNRGFPFSLWGEATSEEVLPRLQVRGSCIWEQKGGECGCCELLCPCQFSALHKVRASVPAEFASGSEPWVITGLGDGHCSSQGTGGENKQKNSTIYLLTLLPQSHLWLSPSPGQSLHLPTFYIHINSNQSLASQVPGFPIPYGPFFFLFILHSIPNKYVDVTICLSPVTTLGSSKTLVLLIRVTVQ